jgi:hypothetical protein
MARPTESRLAPPRPIFLSSSEGKLFVPSLISVGRQIQSMKTRHALTGCFCLLLLALLVWRLAGDGFDSNLLFGAADSANSAPALDSFSEPSVGLAVLKQRAAELMLVYNQHMDQVKAPPAAPSQEGAAIGNRTAPGSITSSSAAFHLPAAPEVSALKGFLALRAKVRDLDFDLDRKLMRVCCLNGWYDEFLDCYLRLIAQMPLDHQPGIQVWTLYALGCAQKCGRAEEVADALHHAIRFYPSLPGTHAMREALDQWEAEHLPVSEDRQQ